jgi:hypothetical protein
MKNHEPKPQEKILVLPKDKMPHRSSRRTPEGTTMVDNHTVVVTSSSPRIVHVR